MLAGTGPPLSGDHSIAFDRSRGRTVLLGGSDGYTQVYTTTLEWDGTTWRTMSPVATIARNLHSMAFDAVQDRLLVYGGVSRIWPANVVPVTTSFYATSGPAGWTGYGAGCPGALGDLELVPQRRPWIGDSCSVELRNVPPASLAFVVAGAVQTAQSLAAVGLPGCTQLVDVQNVFPLATTGGRATWSAAVPSSAALVGVRFHVQGAALSAGGANPFGAVVSAGLQGRIGVR